MIASAYMSKRDRLDLDDADDQGSVMTESTGIPDIENETPHKSFLSSSESTFKSSSDFHINLLPLTFLDVSGCGFGPVGLISLLKCVSKLVSLSVLDISQNNIGPRRTNVTGAGVFFSYVILYVNNIKMIKIMRFSYLNLDRC